LIKRGVTEIIQQDVSDPRIGFFSITSVKVSSDLRHVKITVSFMGSEDEKEKAFAGIKSAEGFIQHKLAKRIFRKFPPVLNFVYDERKEFKIEKIFSEIRKDNDEKDKRQSG